MRKLPAPPPSPSPSPSAAVSPDPLFLAGLLDGKPSGEGVTSLFWASVGPVPLRTGRVVACDPLADPSDRPFARLAPTGEFPVELLVARHGEEEGADERVAAAVWHFCPRPLTDHPPTTWEPATWQGQDATALGPDEFFGYGVDAGTGCFMSDAAARALLARMDAEEDYFETLIREMNGTYRHTRSWAVVRPDAADPDAAAAIFSSGYGDGFYGSWWGLSADGGVLCLATDFGVVGADPAA